MYVSLGCPKMHNVWKSHAPQGLSHSTHQVDYKKPKISSENASLGAPARVPHFVIYAI